MKQIIKFRVIVQQRFMLQCVVCLCMFFLFSVGLHGQQFTVTGTITDGTRNGEIMPAVSVQMKGSTMGTLSGVDGKYNITVRDKESILVFTFQGYATQEIVVGDQREINVTMGARATPTVTEAHTRFCVGLVVVPPYKNVYDENEWVGGLNAGYFFNKYNGAGIALRHKTGIHNSAGSYGNITRWEVRQTFIGAVYYGNWGRNSGKVFLQTNIGVGALVYVNNNPDGIDSNTNPNVGLLLSESIVYRPVRALSFALGFECVLAVRPVSFGALTLGVNYHFGR